MVIYEFYWRDEMGRDLFVGILKERRKNPQRITEESILNWGRKAISHHGEVGDFHFYISEIEDEAQIESSDLIPISELRKK